MGVTKKCRAPDPTNYVLQAAERVNDYLIITVYYPGCTNFGGRKLLMYEKYTNLRAVTGRIDPRFRASGGISPIASFEPTSEGLKLARTLAKAA